MRLKDFTASEIANAMRAAAELDAMICDDEWSRTYQWGRNGALAFDIWVGLEGTRSTYQTGRYASDKCQWVTPYSPTGLLLGFK